MKKYNCRICGAGVYTADTTVESVLCAECERDENMAKMRSPEEIMAEIIAQRVAMAAEDDAEYHLGWVEALEWVLGVDAELDSMLVEEQEAKELCPCGNPHWRDFVEVVRCKDCVYFLPENERRLAMCKRPVPNYPPNWFSQVPVEPDGYCWKGELK